MTTSCVPFIQENELLRSVNQAPTPDDCIQLPDASLVLKDSFEKYLTNQLDVWRLNVVHDKLWRVGLPGKVQPLHHQLVLQREIVVTERVDLHLVWTNNRIFIKPLPPLLLNHAFFTTHLSPSPSLLPSALGLLYTYTKMIEFQTDFALAQKIGLLPSAITWLAWNRFRIDLLRHITHSHQLNKRYHYGELRLSRLNSIYRLYQWSWRGGYFLTHTRYQSFYKANFEWLLLAFAYFSIALSALQVLLAADQGRGVTNGVLRVASLVIGSASMISVVLAVLVMAVLFVTLRLVNEGFAREKRDDVQRDVDLAELNVSRTKF